MSRKLIFGIFVGIVLMSLILISALTTTQVFFDDFETNNFATIWTSAADYVRQNVVENTDGGGTWSIEVDGNVADVLMSITNAQNVSNQTICNLTSRILIESGFDGGEFVCMDYSLDNGATWNRNTGSDGGLGGLCQDGDVDTENVFRTIEYYNDTIFGTQNFRYRFRTSANNANEDAYIDNVNLTCYANNNPALSNITASHTTIKGGNTLTIWANTTENGVNDTEADTLNLYCDETVTPTSANTDCTGGTTTDSTYPYTLSCTFATPLDDVNHTEYCRIYDGMSYSNLTNISYVTDSTAPTTSLVSVAGDLVPAYYDTNNDALTEIIVNGEANMACRWSSVDLIYSAMANDCVISGTIANCSVTDALTQGLITRYVSCQDVYTNEQTPAQNLDVQFTLDYTAPTTSDNSVQTIQVPPYVVTITEADNVDADPTSYYCTASTTGCNPILAIDNGGTITYTSANRGTNYLRYYSVDDAGNTQIVVNKTININQLPSFTSAVDDAVTIAPSTIININTTSYDSDAVEEITLYVCNSTSVTSAGCGVNNYCNNTVNGNISSAGNVSCAFTSESVSGTYDWYAFIYDASNEIAINNFSGVYDVDATAPSITIDSPLNQTYTQNSITFTITVDEALTNAWYSLDSGANNVTLSNNSAFEWTQQNTSIADGGYIVIFWANDSYGNINNSLVSRTFSISVGPTDTTPPSITIISPSNNSYDLDGSVLLNITSDESLEWAGWQNNSGTIIDLDNVSATNWNSTSIFPEGIYNVTFYANDTSHNQANKTSVIYVDLTNPSVDDFSCSDVNDSQDVVCNANVSDTIGLNYVIIGYNATGSWINSSLISLTGVSDSLSYTIASGNTTPLGFTVEIYLYDDSGRNNLSESDAVSITDDTFPTIWNVTYSPNTTDALDPGVTVNVNATIVEDYNISSVVLEYLNISDGIWSSITMTNNSGLVYQASSTIVYNASFVPQNGTWVFRINVTDTQGNNNISQNYSFVVENDLSYFNSTDIPDTKSITTAQESENTSLGWLFVNNTGESALNFTINVTSTIRDRFDINYSVSANATYDLASGEAINLTILVNTTDLSVDLYNYNLTVSSVIGTSVFEKHLNVQTSVAPFLVVTIDSYSSSVTKGQSGVGMLASVTNLGTASASNVNLVWDLPSEFSLASGNLSRSFSSLDIGQSGTNTVTFDVSSSAGVSSANVNVSGTASGLGVTTDSKTITISDVTTTVVVTTPGSPGGGGSGGGSSTTTKQYDKTIEVTRGTEDTFEIEISNKYSNSTLKNLVLDLSGFLSYFNIGNQKDLSQYVEIYPDVISEIKYGETKSFVVTLKTPAYKEYEEHDLKVLIQGSIVKGGVVVGPYRETQFIKLYIQEMDVEEAKLKLTEAEEALVLMKLEGYNIQEVEKLLSFAKDKLDLHQNKEAFDLAEEIIAIKEKSFFVDDLISRIQEAIDNPRKMSLITGNVPREFTDGEGKNFSITSVITGEAIFDAQDASEVLQLAIAAFERGDFALAEERAKSAQILLLLERKGNFGLFVYLYWHIILLCVFAFSFLGVLGFRKYQKFSASRKIEDINVEEENIRDLILSSQKKYFEGKLSREESDSISQKHQKRLAVIRKDRLSLRNRRIKLLKPQEVLKDLDSERGNVEDEIRKIQTAYYKTRTLSEKDYRLQFEALNERLAEIEGERATLRILEEKEKKKGVEVVASEKDKIFKDNFNLSKRNRIKQLHKERKKLVKDLHAHRKKMERDLKPNVSLSERKDSFVNKIKSWFGKDKKGLMSVEEGDLLHTIKKEIQGKDCKGKWIKINHRWTKNEK